MIPISVNFMRFKAKEWKGGKEGCTTESPRRRIDIADWKVFAREIKPKHQHKSE